jgi:hypothetical protein
LQAFQLQVTWTASLGSPFNSALAEAILADIIAGGPTAAIVGDWPGDALADALPTRLTGALHAATLTGRAPELAQLFPAARADWRMEEVWPLARTFLQRDRDWVREFLNSPPQTNETRRTIALLPGFLWAAQFGPMHLLEIGASAGLILHWDKFRFDAGAWQWQDGAETSERPRIDTDWSGDPPEHLGAPVRVASRAGCDRNPLDLADPANILRLRAFVWPDQPERLARLNAAIALAQNENLAITRADAGDWLAKRLAEPLPEGVTIIYHSLAWQYFSAETKAALRAAIAAAGALADDAHRLVWLCFEPVFALGLDGALEQCAVLRTSWPGGESARIANTDGHARRVEYLGAQAVTLNLK